MKDDNDDTVIVAPRVTPPAPSELDLDDTIVRKRGGSVPAPPAPAPVPSVEARSGIHSFTVAGNTHRLDVPAIIGRNPRAPRVVSGPSPELVTVSSPDKQVSSSHVEIRQRGASVIVTDLRSTNGTSVTIPLGQPRTLRQGESIVVSPGSFIDIGDGNIIQILPITAVPERQEGSRD